jgi:hypothetical protein
MPTIGASAATLAACDPTGALDLAGELSLIKKAAAKEVSANISCSQDTSWSIWADFCRDLTCDPLL